MRTAREWRVPPLVMLLGDDSPDAASWSNKRNRLLATALEHYERSVCPGCGQPRHESTDEDGPDYSAEDFKCRGCAVLKDAGGENDEPGTYWYLDVKRRQSRAGVVAR